MAPVNRISRLINPGRRRRDAAPLSPSRNEVAEAAMPALGTPAYRAIVGFDMTGFGAKDEPTQNHVRTALYEMLKKAFTDAGVAWPTPDWREDRGDGVVMIVPFEVADQIVDPVVQHLYAGIRRHNKLSSAEAQVVLRMAVHAGRVSRDDYGLRGRALVEANRLLEAPVFKEAVETRRAVLGLIVSQVIYDAAIRDGLGLIDPDSYHKIDVVNKETTMEAWLHLRSRAEAPA